MTIQPLSEEKKLPNSQPASLKEEDLYAHKTETPEEKNDEVQIVTKKETPKLNLNVKRISLTTKKLAPENQPECITRDEFVNLLKTKKPVALEGS